jgi:hypothetical protein
MLRHKNPSKTHVIAHIFSPVRDYRIAFDEEDSNDELRRPRARLNAQLAMGGSSRGG